MSERCFVKVKWDPATPPGGVGRAVSGFLRYMQHRVAGLLKYAAYRDKASSRAELFGPEGRAGTKERKAFTAFVVRSIEESRPQLFRTRAGKLMDRRRSVSRFVISPEQAAGLDLQQLMRAGVARLEADMGVSGLPWIAAIHRDKPHHHIHFVLAGMYQARDGSYHRIDVPRRRLAAMKEAFALEIARQRGDRTLAPEPQASLSMTAAAESRVAATQPVIDRRPALRVKVTPRHRVHVPFMARRRRPITAPSSLLQIQAAGRRYAWLMARDAALEARRRGWEHAA